MDERLASGAEDRANLNSEDFYLKRKAARSLKARRAYAVRRLNGNSGKGRPKSKADQVRALEAAAVLEASQKEKALKNGLPWPLPPGTDADGNEIVEQVEEYWPRKRGRPVVSTVAPKPNPRGRPTKHFPPTDADHNGDDGDGPRATLARPAEEATRPPRERTGRGGQEAEGGVLRRGRGRPRKLRNEPRRARGRPRKLGAGERGNHVYIEPEELAALSGEVKAWMAAAATEAVAEFPSMAESPMIGPHVEALAIARTNEVS